MRPVFWAGGVLLLLLVLLPVRGIWAYSQGTEAQENVTGHVAEAQKNVTNQGAKEQKNVTNQGIKVQENETRQEEKQDDETEEEETKKWIEEILEEVELDFDAIEDSLNASSLGENISFQDILKKIWTGDTEQIGREILSLLQESLLGELENNRKNFAQIILLAVFAALFANLASGFFSSALQDTGFFIAYLAMTGLVLNSFFLMVSIVEEALGQVFDFMNAFLPAFAITITMVSGSASSIGIYEITFFLVRACQWALKTVILPLIETYMAVEIMNCISETDKFSYFSGLIKKGTQQMLKWATGLVLGMNLIQNMILPAVDAVRASVWQKGVAAIPGAGAVISALTGSFLGASVLIKNSIGVGCLIVLILFCAVPVLKLLLFMLSFFLCSAFLQPVSDKRLMGLLYAAGESSKLLLQALTACFTLFFITIALASISTNMRYYGG